MLISKSNIRLLQLELVDLPDDGNGMFVEQKQDCG
jgi:hypothetical protein